MTEKEMIRYIEKEAIRPGKLSPDDLKLEKEIMHQVKLLSQNGNERRGGKYNERKAKQYA